MLTELIKEAKRNIHEIQRATNNCPKGKYTAFYFSDNGVPLINHIEIGQTPVNRCINFGTGQLTIDQINDLIFIFQFYNTYQS